MCLNTLTQASTLLNCILGDARFESWTRHQLSWLMFYVVSSVPPGKFQDRMLNEVTATSTYFPFHSTLCSLRYCYLPTYLLTDLLTDLALRPSEIDGLLYYWRPSFPIDCPLSPSLNLPLPQFSVHIFQLSESRSSPSASLRFTLKYFLNCPSLIHSY